MKKKTLTSIAVIAILLALCYFIVQGLQPAEETSAYFQATITYTDGTTRVFKPSSPTQTITDPSTGKTVSKIQVELYAKCEFTGTVTSWTVLTHSRTKVLDANKQEKYTASAARIEKSGGSIKNNVAFVVTSATSDAGYLAGIMNSYQLPEGDYYYRMALASPFMMTLTFSDGSKETKQTSETSGFEWKFRYSSGSFKSLSVSWNIVPS